MKKNKENKTIINNWNFGDLFGSLSIKTMFKWLIILIVVTNILSFIHPLSQKPVENKDVYVTCVDSCKFPNVGKTTLKAFDKEFTSIDKDEIVAIPSCIESCNNMYLTLRGKK